MAKILNIVNIPIIVNTSGLSLNDACLIRPFTQKSWHNKKKKMFFASIKNLERPKYLNKAPFSKLKDILKSNFKQNIVTFEFAFRDFIKNLYPCFASNGLNHDKIIQVFKDKKDRVVVHKDFAVMLNKRLMMFNIYHVKNKMPPLTEILKSMISMALDLNPDGLILHASSIKYRGYGYAFVGNSGSGKSTIVKMLRPEKVFSDDMTAIRKTGASYKIFPTPWWNQRKNIYIKNFPRPAVLKALFL